MLVPTEDRGCFVQIGNVGQPPLQSIELLSHVVPLLSFVGPRRPSMSTISTSPEYAPSVITLNRACVRWFVIIYSLAERLIRIGLLGRPGDEQERLAAPEEGQDV